MFYKLWNWLFPKKEEKKENWPTLFLRIENIGYQNNHVYIEVDWPEEMNKDFLRDLLGKLFYSVQSGLLMNTFNDALEVRARKDNCMELVEAVKKDVKAYVDEALKNGNNKFSDDDILIYPSEVFQRRN